MDGAGMSAWLRRQGRAGRLGVARVMRSEHGRRYYLIAVAGVAVLSAGMFGFRDELGVLNVLLLYLLLTFALALGLGAGPAAVGALLCFLTFNFVFIPPYYTFNVARSNNVLALFVYLGVAVVTGILVARVRMRTEEAVRAQRRTTLLYELNAALVGDVTLDQILATIVERVVNVYGAAGSRLLLPDERGELTVRARSPKTLSTRVERDSLAMAGWAMEHRTPAGLSTGGRRIRVPHGTSTQPPPPRQRRGEDVLYVPIATSARCVGVLEVVGRPGGGKFGEEDERLLGTFADQAALALERARLMEEETRAAVLVQADELKSALLSAVSHDLRTPLAAIKASSSALLDDSVPWDEATRRELLSAIDEETDRLTLMVSNLLDLSRIEGGALRPDRDWNDLGDLVHDTVARLAGQTAGHTVTVDVPDDLPLVFLDYVEIGQVLVNLIGNAAKYTPEGTPIRVSVRRQGERVEVRVADRGPGIPADKLPRIFEGFYRAAGDGVVSNSVTGTGIGLAIVKGLVEAHGGTIRAESVEGEGTTMTFTLPVGAPVGATA